MKLIPFAKQSPVRMRTKGRYAGGWPKGAVIHYTAGHDSAGSAQAAISGGAKDGNAYLAIDSDGTLVQGHPIDEWGNHAGKSLWKGYFGGLNDEAIGIEMCSPGLLTMGKDNLLRTYYGKVIPQSSARYVTEKMWGCPTGWYETFSPQQEQTLFRVLKWLHENDPTRRTFKFENVVGHHECAGMKGLGFWRKSDPGGSLSVPMDELRARLIGSSALKVGL